MEVLHLITDNGLEFLKGFVCGCLAGLVIYHFFKKDELKYLRTALKDERKRCDKLLEHKDTEILELKKTIATLKLGNEFKKHIKRA